MLGEYSSVLFCSSEDEGLCVPDRRSEMLPGVIQLMSRGMAGNVKLSLQAAYKKSTFICQEILFPLPFSFVAAFKNTQTSWFVVSCLVLLDCFFYMVCCCLEC